jgi:hypothetical protein
VSPRKDGLCHSCSELGTTLTGHCSTHAPDSGPPAFLIWSEEHGAWWNPRRAGYTTSMKRAGRYSFEEGSAIVERANGGGNFCEVLVPVSGEIIDVCKLQSGGR